MEQTNADPAIIAQVGSVGRPERPLDTFPSLAHIPGRDGAIAGLRELWGWTMHGHAYFRTQAKRHGPMYRAQLGRYKLVVLTDPTLAGQVLRNVDGQWSTALAWLTQFSGLLDGPLDMPLTLDFEQHRDIRRLLQPSFKADALSSYVDVANRHFAPAIDRWVARGRVRFKPEIRTLFAGVSAEVFMGIDDEAEAAKLDRAMSDFWRSPFALVRDQWLSPSYRVARRETRRMEERFSAQVEARRRSDGKDLFTRLCQTNEEVSWLDDRGLVRTFIGVMAAAFDTTSAAVTNMGYLLATHPEWQERVRAEVKRHAPECADYAEIRNFEELDWAWKEGLRFYPVAPSVGRIALRDLEIGGHHIPAGGFATVWFSIAFRDPTAWKDPDLFDPERFSEERAEDKQNKGAFLPFGAGHHACIGSQLAGLEAKAFWYQFLRKARIRLAKPYEARHQFRPLGIVSGDVGLVVEPV